MLRYSGFEQDQLILEQQLIFLVRSVQIDYLKPACFNDSLIVNTEIVLAKKVSLNFEQVITRNEDVVCKGDIRIASLDANSMKPKIIPDFILEKLTND
jgi:acyl-CoA thioester hydrolase